MQVTCCGAILSLVMSGKFLLEFFKKFWRWIKVWRVSFTKIDDASFAKGLLTGDVYPWILTQYHQWWLSWKFMSYFWRSSETNRGSNDFFVPDQSHFPSHFCFLPVADWLTLLWNNSLWHWSLCQAINQLIILNFRHLSTIMSNI